MGNAGSAIKDIASKAWSGIKSVGSNIWGGIKNVGSKVLGIGNTIRNGISKGVNFVKNIPVIGDIVKQGLNTPIPILRGATLNQVGDVASSALDAGNSLSHGDFQGAYNNAISARDKFNGLRNPIPPT